MERRKLMGLGLRLLGVAVIGYVVFSVFSSLFPKDTWPPKDEQDEEKIIGGYKERLAIPDNPLSTRKPEDTPVFLSRIIDHDVKKGNLKSAHDIGQASTRKWTARSKRSPNQMTRNASSPRRATVGRSVTS